MAITIHPNGNITGTGANNFGQIGAVLQTVHASTSDSEYSSSSNSWTDYLSASITPVSSSNKVLIYHVVTHGGDDNSYAAGRCFRSGTGTTDEYIQTPTNSQFTENRFTDSSFPLFMNASANDQYKMWQTTFMHLDTPASSAEVTYTFAVKADASSRTAYINRSKLNPTDGYNPRPVTTVTLMEIKA